MKTTKKKKPWCDHCKKHWHTRETCWKIHGKPPNWKKKGVDNRGSQYQHGQAFQTCFDQGQQSSPETSPFTKEQLEILHKLLQSPQFRPSAPNPSNPSCSFAETGNNKVKIADGSFSAIAGKGTDKVSGKTIGSARESGGLYFLENGNNSLQLNPICLNSTSVLNKVMLWHYRLGHPSFYYLRHLLPQLFRNKNPSLFQCEFCEMAKHHRSFFPSQKYQASKPFTMIHSDVWGPSRISTMSGKRWFVTFIDDHTRRVGFIY
ncbi:uncharacterized protein LOC132042971 [Lycium ferocissimum]|uniref:uncharacterized protein LOC132042971 n=1 Tax=Lycium ferocissimum TaxID=112874 RepID=UPI0028158310|nr:uncharacterized protein LOC132042971 [Lycium ferocissimum]